MTKEKNCSNFWKIVVEVRKVGAIGEFSELTRYVRAEAIDIERYVFDDLAAEGLEPRAIIFKEKLG